MNALRIGRRTVGPGRPCYVIAEIGSNHDGKLAQALRMIAVAAKMGADAVKFQCLDYDRMYAHRDATLLRLFRRIRLDEAWLPKLKACADRHGVEFLASPCYLEAVPLLERVGARLYKIASPQTLAFPQLVSAVARTGKPVVISTGYCEDEAVTRAVRLCRREGNRRYALLHCVSSYPTTPRDAQLRVMDALRQRFRCPVGLSDHSLGTTLATAAAARGACIIEKHFTLDRRLRGPDHAFAAEPEELRALVRAVRDVEAALSAPGRILLPAEERAARGLHYRILAARPITAGAPVRPPFVYRRAPAGIAAADEPRLSGRVSARDIRAGSILHWEDLR
ncbi:MAG: N-acetylneuraminate synthase family protein [Elusimicrobiota bacterium]